MLTAVVYACLMAAPLSAPSADYYVSPAGNDAWSGRLAEPNSSRTDGPLASIEAALRAGRRLNRGANGLTILVRKGIYQLERPLTLGPEDSGVAQRPTLIAAYPGERPILSGGSRITGWTIKNGRWTVTLPDVRAGRWRFEQLFVNGTRRYRPRLPKNGYYLIDQEAESSPEVGGAGFDRFQFAGNDLKPEWRNREDIDLLCFQVWTMARMRIKDIDAAARLVTFAKPTLSAAGYFSLRAGQRYIVENVREALTAPGEWYLDNRTGELSYIPLRGERPDRAEVWAPRLEQLVEFRGDGTNRRWVQHIILRGLTFAHANWTTPAEGYQSSQAEAPIEGAIQGVGARHCTLDQCTITHVGGYGVEFGAACQNCTVRDSTLVDLGAGGVKLGETGGAADPELLSGGHSVLNSLIAHGGRMHPAGIGVWIGASPNNRVAHCEIADLYYTGISVGWSWGYAPTAAHDNIIEHNHIHDIGQGVLSDMGATYTLGLSPGTVQRNNVFHHVESFGYGGWGIYFDEGTTGMLAENNLVYACKSAGFHQHYGRDNTVRNNIFALNRESEIMRSRAEDHLSFTFERNIVYWDTGTLLAATFAGDQYRFQNNLYWRKGGQPFDFAGSSLAEWQARGQDIGSVVADPAFVDPERFNFDLRPSSPSAKIGFRPFDWRRAGRRETGLRAPTKVQTPRAYPAPPPPAPPNPIRLTFEDLPVGKRLLGAVTYEETPEATIRVSDETAASGRKSLKFTDRPAQQARYNPHLFFDPGFVDTVLRGSFAVRIENGARLYHEWRDGSNPYRVGPSIIIDGEGHVTANGRALVTIPTGAWVTIEIVCGVGTKATGRYDLTVRLPGRTAPLHFNAIPCPSRLPRLQWYGFVADADDDAIFYLDDIALRPVRAR